MAVGVVDNDPVLVAFEGIEGDMSPPAGPNSVLDVGVSSGSDEEALEPREVLNANGVHIYLILITKETYNLIGVMLPTDIFGPSTAPLPINYFRYDARQFEIQDG